MIYTEDTPRNFSSLFNDTPPSPPEPITFYNHASRLNCFRMSLTSLLRDFPLQDCMAQVPLFSDKNAYLARFELDIVTYVEDIFCRFYQDTIPFFQEHAYELDIVRFFSPELAKSLDDDAYYLRSYSENYLQQTRAEEAYLIDTFFANLAAYQQTHNLGATSVRYLTSEIIALQTTYTPQQKELIIFEMIPLLYKTTDTILQKKMLNLQELMSYVQVHPLLPRLEFFTLDQLGTFLFEQIIKPTSVFRSSQIPTLSNEQRRYYSEAGVKLKKLWRFIKQAGYKGNIYFFPRYRKNTISTYDYFPAPVLLTVGKLGENLYRHFSSQSLNDFILFFTRNILQLYPLDILFLLYKKDKLTTKNRYLEGLAHMILVNSLAQLAFNREEVDYSAEAFCLEPSFFNAIKNFLT